MHPLTVVVVVVVPSSTTPSRLNVVLMNSSYVRKSPNVTGVERSTVVEVVQSRCNTRARPMMIAKLNARMVKARKPARVYNARRGFTRLTSCRDTWRLESCTDNCRVNCLIILPPGAAAPLDNFCARRRVPRELLCAGIARGIWGQRWVVSVDQHEARGGSEVLGRLPLASASASCVLRRHRGEYALLG